MIINQIKNNTHCVSLIKLDKGYEVTYKKSIYWDSYQFTELVDALKKFNELTEVFDNEKSNSN